MNAVDRPDIQGVLLQMQRMRAAAQTSLETNLREVDLVREPAQNNFSSMLKDAVKSVSDSQMDAGRLTNAFVKGEEQDLVKVMVSMQKANLSFQALTQVRNKVASAYQDIMNMPI